MLRIVSWSTFICFSRWT